MYSEVNYIHRTKTMRVQAKKHLGYIGERPGKDKADIIRSLFGKAGKFTKEQVEKMIEDAPDNTLFWRLKLNPDPVLENPEKILNLEELTRDAVSWLEERIGKNDTPRNIPFVGAIHDDHTPLAHMHAILFIQRQGREKPIYVSVLNDFREYVSQKAPFLVRARNAGREQNYLGQLQEQSLDGIVIQAGRTPEAAPARQIADEGVAASGGGGGGGESGGWADGEGERGEASLGTSSTCPACLIGTVSRRLNSRVSSCDVCGFAMRQGIVINPGRRREAEVGRAY